MLAPAQQADASHAESECVGSQNGHDLDVLRFLARGSTDSHPAVPGGREQHRAVAGATLFEAGEGRITVNYLRHNVTGYDDVLQELRGRVGVRDAEDLVRERVYEAIASRFPELAKECGRQLHRRRTA